MTVRKYFFSAIFCLISLTVFATEIQLNEQEETVAFGNEIVGIKCVRKPAASFTLRTINLQLQETAKTKEDLGEGKWTFSYNIMGKRLVFEAYNKTLETSQVYVYDSLLNVISKRTFTKEQIHNRYKATGSTDSKFDMAEFYNRWVFNISNALHPCDQFLDDGLLYLKCDETLMRTVPYGITNAGKVINENSSTVIYRLNWGNDQGDYAVNFGVKWSVKLPFKTVLGYRFYTYPKNVMFLYIVSMDGDEMRSYFYQLDMESGDIVQTTEVKLPNGGVPWICSAQYDEATEKLLVIGNYQTEKRKKDIFDGYFLSVINNRNDAHYELKPFPALPENVIPRSWGKTPMLISDHFVKNKEGEYTCIASLTYPFDMTSGPTKNAPAASGRLIGLAAIVLVDFDISLGKIAERVFMFDNYDKDANPAAAYDLSTTFQIINRISLEQDVLFPFVSDISANGTTEILCVNTVEQHKAVTNEVTYSYYVLSTASGSEIKKAFDYVPDGKMLWEGYFQGAEGQVIFRWQISEGENYLRTVDMHL